MNSRPRGPAEIDWYGFLERLPLLPAPDLASLHDQCIFVTGAGGSIGSALSLRLASAAPRRLVLLDSSEQSLYRLQLLLDRSESASVITVLGSVNDEVLLDELCERYRPDLVFHAAAHKHAPLLESQPLAAIATNTLGTWALAQALERHHGARSILLSTDKAVDPTSILGATKRVAELITLAYEGTVLRLANVLGSEGSVVDTFLEQIATGRPFTITDPESDRFFLTIEEAVDLLLTAAVGFQRSSLLVPRLDKPHSITALANFLAATQSVSGPVEQSFTALRPGDKLHESLVASSEHTIDGPLPCLLEVLPQGLAELDLRATLARLTEAVHARDLRRAIDNLFTLVPTWRPSNLLTDLIAESHIGVPAE